MAAKITIGNDMTVNLNQLKRSFANGKSVKKYQNRLINMQLIRKRPSGAKKYNACRQATIARSQVSKMDPSRFWNIASRQQKEHIMLLFK